MAKFEISHTITSLNEGGYVNDPDDRGGETAFGIARKFNPDWTGWLRIDGLKKIIKDPVNLKKEIDTNLPLITEANMFYKRRYFTPLKLQQVEQELANQLYDSAVNLGVGAAAKSFQRALNLFNLNGKLYADLKVDGAIGLKTISAYDTFISTSHWKSRNRQQLVKALIKWINFFQMEVYYRANGTNQEKFMLGWTSRV